MWELIYYDLENLLSPTDPDEFQCVQPMWQKFVWSTPLLYANFLAARGWKEEEAPTVNEVAGQLWQYEDLSPLLYAPVSQLWKGCLKNLKTCLKNG